MNDDHFLAHISEDEQRFQTIKEHLEGTAVLAKRFASSFGAGDLAWLAGRVHDLGKYSDKFQERIRNPNLHKGLDHSTAGAKLLWQMGYPAAAFAVAGHHGGLPDGGDPSEPKGSAKLFGRLKKETEDWEAGRQELELIDVQTPEFIKKDSFSFSFFTRMLYSCLVDADYLDTERFFYEGKITRETGQSIEVLLDKLEDHMKSFESDSLKEREEDILNQKRRQVLQACIQHGGQGKKGLYTLTVPTGGGKTLSSLAFALHHAKARGMDRVIYVIPFTSIIDQTAQVFRDALGEENVIEHHSGAEYVAEEGGIDDTNICRKVLATENWDAPVIITTAVQFFESLYASRSSRCRKLHHIANSVIVFDEAQTLPVPYLRPCVAAISQLVLHYGATAVLCTATQPALKPLFDEFAPGLPIEEICPDPKELYNCLRRTTLVNLDKISELELLPKLQDPRQVLCVVNSRRRAQEIYRSLTGAGNYCLSTLIYPAQRKKKLAEIRRRLREGKECRVISTSLIEAGVDVDFPTAYREEAGLDSILQTAGRCNREGKRTPQESKVHIFRLEGQRIPSLIRQNVDAAHIALRNHEDAGSPEAIGEYSRLYLNLKGRDAQDKYKVLDAFYRGIKGNNFPFQTVAQSFSLIDSPTQTIYLPLDEGEALVERLRRGELSRSLFRALGQYSISVYPDHFQRLYEAGALELLADGSAVLAIPSYYNDDLGLSLDPEGGFGWII